MVEEESQNLGPGVDPETGNFIEDAEAGEVSEVNFDDLSVGDQLIVDTSDDGLSIMRFEISIVKKPKNPAKPLVVKFSSFWVSKGPEALSKHISKSGNITYEPEAKMPGGYRKQSADRREGWAGISFGTIRVGALDTLLFQRLKDESGEDISPQERSMPIRRIEIIKA